jgi:hypothetical protein
MSNTLSLELEAIAGPGADVRAMRNLSLGVL